MIFLCLYPDWLYDSVHELMRMAFPGEEMKLFKEDYVPDGPHISMRLEANPGVVKIAAWLDDGERPGSEYRQSFVTTPGAEAPLNEQKQLARMFTFDMLARHLGKRINAYGILTGMRPVKLVHRFIDRGQDQNSILKELTGTYRLESDKAGLLWEVASNNRPFLPEPEAGRRSISVYVGIPFCPSRCHYCSFPGAVLRDYLRDITPFMEALGKEIVAIGQEVADLGLNVQTVYIGGGTPTVLSEEDLQRLFELLQRWFISSATTEITVEAGRADTLNQSNLNLLKRLGVNRLCVNPQTMNDHTLQTIGRHHDVKGVVQSVEWAWEAGIEKVNMDLIVGLPGEGPGENTYTAQQILKLKPENITVHTLAIKRGASMSGSPGIRVSTEAREREVMQGVDYFAVQLRDAGYIPYYLYRQKYMRASMENTGYSLPGSFCLYNIQMIEERQTILGLGGGAASKFVVPGTWDLTSAYNPRDPYSYCQSLETLIGRKVDKLRALH